MVRALRKFAAGFAIPRRWWVVVWLLLGAGICLWPTMSAGPTKRLLGRAVDALERARYEEAERLARAVLERWPEHVPALLIAGEAAVRSDRSDEALAYFLRVPAAPSAEYVRAQYGAATRLLLMGQAHAAEKCLRSVLALDPQHEKAHEKLAVLLQVEGRTWEALPHAQALLLAGQCSGDRLLMIGGIDAMMVHNPHLVDTCLRTVPEDPLVLLGRARLDLIENRVDRAEWVFQQIIARDPHQIEAQARLGEVLLNRADSAAFLRWHAALPSEADRHPHIWYLRGMWAKRQDQLRAAVRCFLESLRLHPHKSSANFQLSQALIALGLSEAAESFADHARTLSKLEFLLHELRGLTDLEMMRQVAEINEQLGRHWEAAGWCQTALFVNPQTPWAKAKLKRGPLRAVRTSEFTLASAQPALRLDVSAFPLPQWRQAEDADMDMAESADEIPGKGTGKKAPRGPVDGTVRLLDMAAETGLLFQYHNGTTSTSGLEHILQTVGGGVGCLDYDADGWPDLYFAQAGRWEDRGEASAPTDRLFRNLGDGRFLDVTEQAGLGDREFSQGITVGDYNNDGFPDLYVANVGPNRLYRNNGDGTFTDITEQAGVGGREWTASGAWVDLNGDGNPEIYAVNYLLLDEVLKRRCARSGHPMGCSPTMFTAEQDRLYENLGDDRFRDVTEECGIEAADGKGLGVLAADFDGSGRINVFVANDTTANFYFVNQTAGPGQPLSFAEQGLQSGLAFNEAGQAQACMGIAAGDVDGDRRLDLLVGNFYADSNTLYLQTPEHTFLDESRAAGLREPSFDMLTFGTQFLDGDLDGWLDLIVSNGHVDRAFDPNVPDLMPPQYFQNLGQARFRELSAHSLGPYFQQQYLGRSVALLDWNRDGKPDICISHLDAPVALLTNDTSDAGHYLAVTLIGVSSSRDAFGSELELSAGARTQIRQVIAGSGFMASNERKILFGLGHATRIDRLQVRWPSGAIQVFEGLDSDQELAIVEGVDRTFRRDPPRFSATGLTSR